MQLRERTNVGGSRIGLSPLSVDTLSPSCDSCHCPNNLSRRLSQDSDAASVYREHAAHYAHKFRASIDYKTREEPRQIVWGCILVLVLLLLGFRDQFFSSPSAVKGISSALPGGGEISFPTATSGAQQIPPSSSAQVSGTPETGAPPSAQAQEGKQESDSETIDYCQRFPEDTKCVPESPSGHVVSPSFFSSLFGGGSSPAAAASPLSTGVRRVVLELLVLVCIYCFLQAKDGLLVRPHPGFWRVVHGVCLVHLIVMVVLLAVDVETGRTALQLLFPEIVGAREKVFAGTLVMDCRINGDTIMRQLRSVWFVSHVVGWLCKMVILRNWGFCLLYSVAFEIGELSFQWLVPELCECWWDSIFIDALLSNVSGMLLGAIIMKLINMHQYDWLGRYPLYQKVLMSLTPFSSEDYDWSFYKTPRHLFLAITLLVFCLFTELNVFFLMAVLDIPAVHYINPLRTLYLSLLGAAAAAEHYEYTMYSRERIGHNEWLLAIILCIELLVCVKYGASRFPRFSPPPDIFMPWIVALSLFGAWSYCYFTTADLRGLNSGSAKKVARIQMVRDANGGAKNEPKGDSTVTKRDEVKRQSLSWQDQAKLLVITLPPQACFLPLLYLMKFYFYDYVRVEPKW
ncbi:putative phosphatidylserine synthase [Besnoitia besnoiti]|uniref:Putative phosphatidylserine synthase n=1 Tax=Besnoitia besnoiti TaxID=94643 RepID=A0A2A9MQQ0_BESBE|nr:putative phosphatidylserine synthase [Besnoitia besnoiti]PFH38392.1 putative phosphatidylserine synthase [Besnoitia besnoiti]